MRQHFGELLQLLRSGWQLLPEPVCGGDDREREFHEVTRAQPIIRSIADLCTRPSGSGYCTTGSCGDDNYGTCADGRPASGEGTGGGTVTPPPGSSGSIASTTLVGAMLAPLLGVQLAITLGGY